MGSKNIAIGASGYISASSVADLYGCGFGSKLEMYHRYKGLKFDKVISDEVKESMAFGTAFESTVAKYAAKKLGLKNLKACKTLAFWADDMPYFICHPDFLVKTKDKNGRRVAIECKCVKPFAEGWGESGSTEIPDNYRFQVQSYFACEVPCDVVYVACMKGNRINIYEILPDANVIASIRAKVKEAKEEFDAGIVPEAKGFDETVTYYKAKVDLTKDLELATDPILELYKEISKNHTDLTEAQAEEKRLKEELIKKIGEGNVGFYTHDADGAPKKICYWSEKNGNPKLNFDKFAKEHPDINLEDYMERTKNRQFNIAYTKE